MEHTKSPWKVDTVRLFKTSVSGVGPFCVEFPDGEIIHTRTELRQHLIAASADLLQACEAALTLLEHSKNVHHSEETYKVYAELWDARHEACGY